MRIGQWCKTTAPFDYTVKVEGEDLPRTLPVGTVGIYTRTVDAQGNRAPAEFHRVDPKEGFATIGMYPIGDVEGMLPESSLEPIVCDDATTCEEIPEARRKTLAGPLRA